MISCTCTPEKANVKLNGSDEDIKIELVLLFNALHKRWGDKTAHMVCEALAIEESKRKELDHAIRNTNYSDDDRSDIPLDRPM